jgi:hypothetical protein
MRVTYLRAFALIVVVMLAGCENEELPPGPSPPSGPGFLQVLLETPRTNDGALLITLSGGPLDSLRVAPSATLLTAPPGVNDQQVIIAGDVRAGVVLRFWVPERTNVLGYRAVLDQVATRGDYIQQPLTDYLLTIATD